MPFADGTCGPNLEYDNEFMALQRAALGRPETQFEAALPPDWPSVEKSAAQLLARSRDLRLAALWLEARLNQQGLESLPAGFNSIASLLENAWSTVNPPLDEGDPYARLNVIEGLGAGGFFYQSLRNCKVVQNSRIGDIRLKDFELLTTAPQGAPLPFQREQVEQYLRSPEGSALQLSSLVQLIMASLDRLLAALAHQVEASLLPQLQGVKSLLACLQACLPQQLAPAAGSEYQALANQPVQVLPSNNPVAGTDHTFPQVRSRQQALAAIQQVCIYLEQAEPTNPAQLLLNRATRLMNQPFLHLIKNLAPDALAEVAKIMGVNPDSLEQGEP
ncbi:MAG TPA: type VI secretion system ImpA family N-terminal domain-containing protein [Limnobacter sp.]|nr:type VI secretion system ImpA family N-terminal domain-containing protein [Limnobacter sp.]